MAQTLEEMRCQLEEWLAQGFTSQKIGQTTKP